MVHFGLLTRLLARFGLFVETVSVVGFLTFFELIFSVFVFTVLRWFLVPTILALGRSLGHPIYLDRAKTPPSSKDKTSLSARCFPKWGVRHLTVWFLDLIDKIWLASWSSLFPFQFVLEFSLRWTGASVGQNCVFTMRSLPKIAFTGDLSLLRLEDGAILDDWGMYSTYQPDDSPDRFVEAPIVLERWSKTMPFCSVGPGCTLEESACLGAHGALEFGRVPAGRLFEGVPAVDVGKARRSKPR